MADLSQPFWQQKTMMEMDEKEWESLCDHCGRCCLHKFEDEQETIHYTNVVCRLYAHDGRGCGDYQARQTLVRDCLRLQQLDHKQFRWLPESCAYRLLSEGKTLPLWHPLRSGNATSVANAGMTIAGRVVRESDVDDLESHIISWVQ